METEQEYLPLFEIGKAIQLKASPGRPLRINTSAGYIRLSIERERQWVYEMVIEPDNFRRRIADECGSEFDVDEVVSLFKKLHQKKYTINIKDYIPWNGYSISAEPHVYDDKSKKRRFIHICETENGMPYNLTHKLSDNWASFYYQELPMEIESALQVDQETEITPERIAHLRKMYLNQNGFPDSPEWYKVYCGPYTKRRKNNNRNLEYDDNARIGWPRFSEFHLFTIIGISVVMIFAPIILVFGALCLPYLVSRMGAR